MHTAGKRFRLRGLRYIALAKNNRENKGWKDIRRNRIRSKCRKNTAKRNSRQYNEIPTRWTSNFRTTG